MQRSIAFLLLLSLLWLGGCDFTSDDDLQPASAGTVLVASSGNFSAQNGFVTSYDVESDVASSHDGLAGFLQGMGHHDDALYVLINTFSTGRVDVLDAVTFQRTGQITGLPAPRDIAFHEGKAWVSNLIFGSPGTLVSFDLQTHVLSDPIAVGSVPEGVAALAGSIFVADNGSLGSGSTVDVVDPGSGSVSGQIDTGCDGPKDLYAVQNDVLVIVCTGKTVYNADFSEIIDTTPGQVVFVDAETETVMDRITLPAQAGSTSGTDSGAYARDTDELFVMLPEIETILVVYVSGRTVLESIAVPVTEGYTGLSGVAYDAGRDVLYVSRLAEHAAGGPDYEAAGTVLRLGRDGTPLGTFSTGPSPSVIRLLHD